MALIQMQNELLSNKCYQFISKRTSEMLVNKAFEEEEFIYLS